MLEKVKSFVGFNDDFDDDEDDIYETEVINARKSERIHENTAVAERLSISKTNNNVNSTSTKVFILKPKEYEDCRKAVDELKNNKIVVLNIEKIETEEVQKEIFEFIKGSVYALEASIQKISFGIFLLAPKNVQVDEGFNNNYGRNLFNNAYCQ
jgi:cell division inhibitor SepF